MKRKSHGAGPLTTDESAAKTLQEKINAAEIAIFNADGATTTNKKWEDGAIDLEKAKLDAPTGCIDAFFKYDGANGASDLSFMTKSLGVDKWYSYSNLYDFDTGKNIYPATAKEQADKDKVDNQAHYLKSLLWK